MTISGGGTLVLPNANTGVGRTTVNSGTVRLQNGASLGAGSISFIGGTIKGDKEISVTVVQYGSAGNTPLPDAWVRIEKGGGTKESKTAFLEMTRGEWDRILAVNLTAVFDVTQRAARRMLAIIERVR